MPEHDLHRVLIEIEEEVRAKRASGELPADLERELDMVFARLAPAGAVQGDFDQLLERAESQAFFDLIAPNESVRPGVPYVKRIVQKTVRWYMRYVIEQVTGFAQTITKATRQLDDRVTHTEQMIAPTDELNAVLKPRNNLWDERIVETLKETDGRVLHARCAQGELVKSLCANEIDAYGVDPAAELVALGTADAVGLDLRPDDEREHLRALAPGVLGGLVLTGCVDFLSRGAQIELADLAAMAVGKDGVLVLISTHPRAWASGRSPLEVDLAQGRPIHIETWQHLFEDRGFSVTAVEHSAPSDGLAHEAGESEVARQNIERLNQALFPPSSSMLVARR